MRVPVRLRPTLFGVLLTMLACLRADAAPLDNATVAQVGERAISLEELDRAAGRAVYEAREQLYEVRVRALYHLLSNELLEREASERKISSQQLIETEVTPHVTPVTDAEIDAFLKAQRAAPAPDERGRKQAQVYLGMKRQADAKRAYVTRLFEKYKVRVSLAAPPPPAAESVRGENTPVLGKADAPVTIIAFSDYRCPYCRELSRTLAQLRERYPEQVNVVYRHYPLHEDSEALAQGALCAADQGQFEAYHDAIFAKNASAADLDRLAESLSLDRATFSACVKAGQHRSRIAADLQEGQRLGITGTPTLFVAGQRLRGAQTLDRLSASVQDALRASTLAATPSARDR